MSRQSYQKPVRTASRISLACVTCRSRHVKCDGKTPVCSRCQREESECVWLKSRRGGRPRRQRKQQQPHLLQYHDNHQQQQQTPSATEALPSNSPHTDEFRLSLAVETLSDESWSELGALVQSTAPPSISTLESFEGESRRRLVDSFYEQFYPDHPCCLPRTFLERRFNRDDPTVKLLFLVMDFVGSLYLPHVPSEAIEDEIRFHILQDQCCCNGPYEVQAMVLYLTAVYWRNEADRACKLLKSATTEAFRLGMHHEAFAIENSCGDPVLAESWRRTWWQLYLTDVHVTAMSYAPQFDTSLKYVNATTGLPCEEAEYERGEIPPPRSIDQYENREFILDNDKGFSSFAQLIGLARGCDKYILGCQRKTDVDSKSICINADSMAAAWMSLLPKSKKALYDKDGNFDLLLFKAKALIPVYIVDIHRALSSLSYNPIEAISSCAPPPPLEDISPRYLPELPVHTNRILRALEDMSQLLSISPNFIRHTPFSICMISSTAIVYLSACKHVLKGPELQAARERIKASIGALEVFAEVWPRAVNIVHEVKVIARELLDLDRGVGYGSINGISERVQTAPESQAPQNSGDMESGTFECPFGLAESIESANLRSNFTFYSTDFVSPDIAVS